MGLERGVSKVVISAMVLPKEKLAPELKGKNPEEMTPKEYETWYCSPIIEAVSKQIEEVIPGSHALPIRQITEAEGAFLLKIEGLIALITLFALTISVLGVMATLHTAILERTTEIGLMKALGASDLRIADLFGAEVGIIAVGSGVLGYGLGYVISLFIGEKVFGSSVSPRLAALGVTLAVAILVTLAGSAPPLCRAMKIDPTLTLRGE